MSEPVSVARQATFHTEPAEADTASGNSIRRGNIVIPVVEEPPVDEADPRRLSLVSSGRSSPIYANGDPEIKKYRTGVYNSVPPRATTRPPSNYGDSSELEILSDVGLAGDSDTDVPPKLSLSARKKIRKEPRIKVPSAKFDSSEPPIQEETTQDVLTALETIVSPEAGGNTTPRVAAVGIRSDTVVVDTPRKRKAVSFDLTPGATEERGLEGQQKERVRPPESSTKKSDESPVAASTAQKLAAQSPRRGPNSKGTQKDNSESKQKLRAGRLHSPSNSLQADDPEALDSSFCESDWQPKHAQTIDNITSPRIQNKETKNGPKNRIGDREKNVAFQAESDKVNNQNQTETPRDSKLSKNNKPIANGSVQDGVHSNKDKENSTNVVETDKKIISNKYETDVKQKARLDIGKRWASQSKPDNSKDAGPVAKDQNERIHQTSHDLADKNNDKSSRLEPELASASLSHPQTPVISNFMEKDAGAETDASIISDWNWNTDSVSGIPKQGRLSKEGKTSDKTKQTTAEFKNPLTSQPTTPRMATSDGYDYESETFEEVLKERNAMVKAERTYQRRIKQLEEELKGMVNQCQLLSDENKELRKNLEAIKKSKEKTVVIGESDSVDMASRIAKLETEKENLTNSNEKLTTKLKDNEVKMKQWDSVFVENTKLKTKNAELERKVHGLEKQMDSLSIQARESDTEAENRLHHSNTKTQELQAQMNELKTENKALMARVKSLENTNQSLSTTLDEKRTELNEVLRAMQTETATESDLKNSKVKLERAQEEVDSVKQELEQMKQLLKASEESKAKLHGQLSQKDTDIKKIKVDVDNKDNVISDLRKAVDKGKQEILRLEEEQQGQKDLERETLALKSRIGSLKAEIESSLAENQKLKLEREEMGQLIERLRHENAQSTDAVVESRKYFRKWEHERDTRNKAEVEMAKKEEEVQILDARLKEAGNKLNVLYSRVRMLEDEKAQIGSASMQEVETNNKILKDENKKLRQMLVERNIELTNKKSEQTVIDTRIRVLERKQQDAEVRVRQLSGWVSGMEEGSGQPETTNASFNNSSKADRPPRAPTNSHGQSRNASKSHNEQRPPPPRGEKSLKVLEPKVAYVSPRTHFKGKHRAAHSTMTPPPGWEEDYGKHRSEGDGHNHTPCSLPLILDTKSMTPPDPHGGYFMLYKEKLKRMKDRKF